MEACGTSAVNVLTAGVAELKGDQKQEGSVPSEYSFTTHIKCWNSDVFGVSLSSREGF